MPLIDVVNTSPGGPYSAIMDMAVAEALPASVPLVSSVGSDNEC